MDKKQNSEIIIDDAEESSNKVRLKVLSEIFNKIAKTDDYHEHFKLIKRAKDKIGDSPNNSKKL